MCLAVAERGVEPEGEKDGIKVNDEGVESESTIRKGDYEP